MKYHVKYLYFSVIIVISANTDKIRHCYYRVTRTMYLLAIVRYTIDSHDTLRIINIPLYCTYRD